MQLSVQPPNITIKKNWGYHSWVDLFLVLVESKDVRKRWPIWRIWCNFFMPNNNCFFRNLIFVESWKIFDHVPCKTFNWMSNLMCWIVGAKSCLQSHVLLHVRVVSLVIVCGVQVFWVCAVLRFCVAIFRRNSENITWISTMPVWQTWWKRNVIIFSNFVDFPLRQKFFATLQHIFEHLVRTGPYLHLDTSIFGSPCR